jgi:hypothetical protein
MADPTQQLQQMLNNAESSFGGLNSAGQQLASALLQAAKAGNAQTTAATATSQSLAQLTARSQSVSAGIGNIGGAFTGLLGQANSLTIGMYGADKAFTSVIPTLNAVSAIFSKVATGLGQLGSGVTIAGFSFGRASEAAAKFATTGIEVIQGILTFQLEAAQKVADTYSASAKAGAMFGGSITRLGNAASLVEVPIQTLVKVITNNVESLSKLGLGQENAGMIVAGMTREIFDSNSALRVLYGNFDELSTGVADYLASQAQLGLNAERDYAVNRAAATDYLYRQKELTAITGKNAELLKKEEEARRNQLDYNLKLGRLGDDARKNVAEGLAISGKIFGSEGAKYAEEYFATGGKVYSKSALAYQAMNQDAAAVMAGMMGAVDQTKEGFRTFTGSLLKDAAPALEAYARSNENLAEINRAANNPFITSMTSASAAIMENLTFLKNSTELFARIQADRENMEKKPLDPATKAYADAQAAMLNNQMLIDKTVLKNMTSMGETIALMNKIQLGFISLQADANAALNEIIKSGFSGTEAFDKFLNKLLTTIAPNYRLPTPSTTPAVPPRPGVLPLPEIPPTFPGGPRPPPSTTPSPVSQSTPLLDESRERTAALQSDIDRLNREVLAMRNTPPPINGENTDLQKSMLAELQDHSTKLDRIRDALA